MPPQTLHISLASRYQKALQDLRVVEQQLKEEQNLRHQAEQRLLEREEAYPDHGLRLDRLEQENKKLKAKIQRQEKRKQK